MISNEFLEISYKYFTHKNKDIVYESLRLFGSLISIMAGRNLIKMEYIAPWEDIIITGNLKCR